MRVNSFHPTTNQKRVLAKILASPTPVVAGGEISHDVNMMAARDQLMKLGVITFSPESGAAVTARGNQIATDENIVDQAGQLTPDGEALAFSGSDQSGEQPAQPTQTAPMESMSLLKELLEFHDNTRR